MATGMPRSVLPPSLTLLLLASGAFALDDSIKTNSGGIPFAPPPVR
jgi:hypothetical protein